MNMESITAKGYRIFAATLLTQKQKGPVSAASKHPQNPVFEISIFFIQFFFDPSDWVDQPHHREIYHRINRVDYSTNPRQFQVASPCKWAV